MKTDGILYQTYKQIIEKIFSNNDAYISKSELLKEFNNNLESQGFDKKNIRTLDRYLKQMKYDDYEFSISLDGHNRLIRLNSNPNQLVLSQNEINAFPLIFGTMETADNLPTIKKIKELVIKEYGFREDELIDSKYFVKSEPEINNHSKILLLAGKLIQFAKNGIVAKYWYINTEGKEDSKYVAPLQIRLYDNRYYLIGLDIDSETGKASEILKNYCLDTFLEQKVEVAYYESKDGLGEPIRITFNHDELYKMSDLNNKLKHSIGIWYDPKNNLKIFKIKFYGWAKGIVLNKKIHHSQKVIEKKANYVIIQIAVWENNEIDYITGRFGNKCEKLN